MKLRKLRDDEHGVLGFFLAFVLSATMLVFLFACAIPFMVSFTVSTYEASDQIIADAEEHILNIRNESIKARILSGLEKMQDSTAENIEQLSFFYQYGWIFVVIVTIFTIFMLARQVVETKDIGVV
jgi:predicted PurR-regulated permease PerM